MQAIKDNYITDKRILLVDDEKDLARMTSSILEQAGFRKIDTAYCAQDALYLIESKSNQVSPYDMLILDVMMPHLNGFDLLEQIKRKPDAACLPTLFLTAKDEPHDRVRGLSLGADDYVVKPYLPQELILRVFAILRRCYPQDNLTLQLNSCTVNLTTAEAVHQDGRIFVLTAKEHEILSVLSRNLGRIVTIDALCEACWGSTFSYENSLMAHIRRLREKIEENPSKPRSLITARGLGYRLVEE